MLNKLLEEIIVGKSAEGIVGLLNTPKYVNEFVIAKKLGITINQTRNILYKISDYGLVSSIRKKDKKKGWYTYFWKFEILKCLEFLKDFLMKNKMQIQEEINLRKSKVFYVCESCGLEYGEDEALLMNFTCDECGEIFTVKDSSKLIKDFERSLLKIDDKSKSTVKANIIKVSILENKIKANGNTSSAIFENKTPTVTIKADEQEFDMDSNMITAVGNVVIDYQDIKTNSDSAKIKVDESGKPKLVNLVGSARVTQGKNIVNATNLLFNPVSNELIATGNAKSETILDDMTQVTIWSDYQQFDQTSNTLITSGRVKIVYKDYIATGPKAIFLPDAKTKKPNKILFMGRSKIQEGSRIVEADKLEMTVEPKTFTAEGNVRSQFTQVSGLKNSKPKTNNKKPSTHEDVYDFSDSKSESN